MFLIVGGLCWNVVRCFCLFHSLIHTFHFTWSYVKHLEVGRCLFFDLRIHAYFKMSRLSAKDKLCKYTRLPLNQQKIECLTFIRGLNINGFEYVYTCTQILYVYTWQCVCGWGVETERLFVVKTVRKKTQRGSLNTGCSLKYSRLKLLWTGYLTNTNTTYMLSRDVSDRLYIW